VVVVLEEEDAVADEEEDVVLLVEEEVVAVDLVAEEAVVAVDSVAEEAGPLEVGAEAVAGEEDAVASKSSIKYLQLTRATVETLLSTSLFHYTLHVRALVFCNIANYEYHVHVITVL
jgi:hypothetical protein